MLLRAQPGFGATRPGALSACVCGGAVALGLAAATVMAETIGAAGSPVSLPPAGLTGVTGPVSGANDAALDRVPARRPPVPHQFLVRFRSEIQAGRQHEVLEAIGPQIKKTRWLGARIPGATTQSLRANGAGLFDHLALIETDAQADATRLVRQLQNRPDVLYVEPNYRLHICDTNLARRYPNDFEFARQWGLQNTGQNDGLAGADIAAPAAWAFGVGDRRVKVAVIDTGIDYFHPDLEANVWVNPGEIPGNGEDDDHDGYIDDVHGYDFVSDDSDPMDDQSHGTHVAGIIGAVGNDTIGVAGVCWQVTLMAIKAFDESGEGALADVVDAIHYAIRHGAQVINASWATTDKSQALKEAILEAHQAGIIVVAAAGNERSETAPSPAGYPTVIAVAATNRKDQRAQFSNFGDYVALAAPGETIFSTLPNNAFDFLSGTSMSAPHVSGVAALILANHPEFSGAEVETILRNAVDAIQPDNYVGAGRLNAWKAARVERPLPVARLDLPKVLYGVMDVRGAASGLRFASYALDYGVGLYPTNWTSLHASTTPVADGVLFKDFSTVQLAEGDYTFRLRVADSEGEEAVHRARVTVRNVWISSPENNDVLRAGGTIPIQGTVFGADRVYAIEWGVGWQPNQWSSNGIILANGGTRTVVNGPLADWNTRGFASNQFYTLRLTAQSGGTAVGESRVHLVYLDGQLRPGWPQYVPIEGDYVTNDWREVTVADLDHDGFSEILRVDPGNSDGKPARLLVYGYDGQLRWSRELDSGEPYSDIPVVGDVDGDGFAEIFVDVGAGHNLYAFRHDGTPLGGNWPFHLEVPNLGKVLADLDGDGKLELIAYAAGLRDNNEAGPRQLLVLDGLGNVRRKWDLLGCELAIDAPKIFPAVGNLDEFPDLEIVAVSGCNQITAFSLRKPAGPLWTASAAGAFLGSPVVGDLHHSGTNEVILGAYDTRSPSRGGTRGGVYAFDRNGRLLPGWPVLVDESFVATPALADLYGDGRVEIILPSWFSQQLHVLQHTGFEADGWPAGPYSRTVVKGNPVIGDITGDGQLKVVMASAGQFIQTALNGDYSTVGGVKAWTVDGQEVDLNDHPLLTSLVMESAGGSSRLKAAAVTLTDLDHNGLLDVVATTIEDRAYSPSVPHVTRKGRYSIYVWELGVPYVATNLPWPMFQRDPQHTGYLAPPKHTNAPPVVTNIFSQTVPVGGAFFPIELDRYVDDPDNRPEEMTWTVEGNQELQVLIGANRVATLHPPSPTWTGQEAIKFIARDPGGLIGADTAVFSVKAGYVPPLAADDQVTTPENVSVEIDVLANDSDARGYPLTVVQFSRPRFGSLRATAPGKLLYQPRKDFSGTDGFTYTISNGKDGLATGRVKVEVSPVEQPPVAVEDFAITLENQPIEIDLLANDTDAEEDPLTLVSFSQPTNGTVTATAPGRVRYVPLPSTHGLDGFTYLVTDGHFATQGAVSIMVNPVNEPPVAQDLSFSLNRNTQREVLFQATDPDGDELTFKVIDGPKHGSLWNYPRLATYYPTKGYAGPDRFTYQANDGELDSQVATVTFEVLAVNNPPNAEGQSLVTRVDHSRKFTLTAPDPDDDPVTFSIVASPRHGSLSGAETNYTYKPDTGFLGDDQFTFRASDGAASSPETAIAIRVTDQNTAPVASDSEVTVKLNVPSTITLQATDNEGDPLTFTVVTNPVNGRLSGTLPDLVFTPNTNYLGPDRLVFKASDGDLESDNATVTISVVFPNHEPETKDQSLTIPSEKPWRLALDLADIDGDALRCAILKGPRFGRVTGLGTSFVYTPRPGFAGSDTFTYKAWDGHTYSPVTRVTLYVTSVIPETKPIFDSVKALDGGRVRLQMRGQPGAPLKLQSSTNLVNWTTLTTLLPDADTLTFVHTNTVGVTRQFYRAYQTPQP